MVRPNPTCAVVVRSRRRMYGHRKTTDGLGQRLKNIRFVHLRLVRKSRPIGRDP